MCFKIFKVYICTALKEMSITPTYLLKNSIISFLAGTYSNTVLAVAKRNTVQSGLNCSYLNSDKPFGFPLSNTYYSAAPYEEKIPKYAQNAQVKNNLNNSFLKILINIITYIKINNYATST